MQNHFGAFFKFALKVEHERQADDVKRVLHSVHILRRELKPIPLEHILRPRVEVDRGALHHGPFGIRRARDGAHINKNLLLELVAVCGQQRNERLDEPLARFSSCLTGRDGCLEQDARVSHLHMVSP